ncbi:MAG: hypothetical protein ACTSUE_17230 [Promethearchaeota archaeon]
MQSLVISNTRDPCRVHQFYCEIQVDHDLGGPVGRRVIVVAVVGGWLHARCRETRGCSSILNDSFFSSNFQSQIQIQFCSIQSNSIQGKNKKKKEHTRKEKVMCNFEMEGMSFTGKEVHDHGADG